MKKILILLWLFIVVSSSFGATSTYIKGPQLSTSNQTIVASGGTTTLTVASPMGILVTGTSSHTIKLPVVGTLFEGFKYHVLNKSTQNISVVDSSSTLLATIYPNTDKSFELYSSGVWGISTGAGASDHNSLTSLQGGTVGEYYHLTAAEDTAVASLSGTTTNYVLKRSATGFANSQIFDNGTNVGIGTATPDALYELDVVGGGRYSGPFAIQSGAAAGSFRLGADLNATTVTTSVRKLARATMPSFDTAYPDVALFAGDSSSVNSNIITFGGVPSSASVVAATRLEFLTAATATTTGGTARMVIDNNGNVGIGTTNPSAAKLVLVGGMNAVENVTNTASGSTSPYLFTLNINPASTSSTEFRALGFSATTQGSSQLATVRGGYFEVRNTSSGTITNASGITSTAMLFPSTAQNFGPIYDIASFYAIPVNSFSNTVTGTITNARGFRMNNAGLTVNQVLTNQVGISLDALTSGTNNTYVLLGTSIAPTGNFGIYSATASNSYFNGSIGIGTTAPATKLHVSGDSTVTGYQYFGLPTTDGSFRMYVSGGALKIEKRISGTWTSVGKFDEL